MYYPSTPYTPRSGAFRKVKHTLPIYDLDDISAESKDKVIKIAAQLKEEEETEQRKKVMVCEDESGESQKGNRRKSIPPSTASESSGQVITKETSRGLEPVNITPPQSATSIINEDVYDKLYPEDFVTLSSFPIISCSDPMCDETEEPDSEYDMDSDDEDWINSNPQLNITPPRLEYLFTQLNKRNTHVKTTAMWALRPPYHEDFHKIFPYWKEKRLLNNNVSTWRPQKKSNKEAKFGGYVSTDPYTVFQSKGCKPQPLVKSTKKHYSNEDVETIFDRVLEIRKKIIQIRSWAHFEVISGEQTRDHLVKTYTSVDESCNQISSQSQESSSRKSQDSSVVDVDANNNETSTIQAGTESKPETPRRKSSERRRSIRTLCRSSQSTLTLPSKTLQRGDKQPKELKYDDVLKGRWRTIAKKLKRNDIKENQPFYLDLKYPGARQKSLVGKGLRNVIRAGNRNTV
ncbi:unnamed protein product [Orchesella dallaii]|uniref:Enhancer of polycomb-like protein n=1 Tax=Orchesella dallaii TaxID=48710 RepID=A0ABP1R7M8_9HEXA